MSMSKLSAAEGPEDSAVQNRLTAAGLVLTTLFFAGSFALALNGQSERRRPYASAFGYLEVALVVGALLAIAAITALLACQQCARVQVDLVVERATTLHLCEKVFAVHAADSRPARTGHCPAPGRADAPGKNNVR